MTRESAVGGRSKPAASDSSAGIASVAGSVLIVAGFWWAATGVTLALHRNEQTSSIAVLVATLFAAAGVLAIVRTRNQLTPRSARLAFLGSSLLWWWCSSLFYAGIGVHINAPAESGPRTLALAMQAINATIGADLFGVVSLAAVALLVGRSPNRVALWTFVIYWGTLQTAKLNVFMGVRNSGADWLPAHLEPLSQFFGPARNSLLLPVTVVLLTACLVYLFRRATQPTAAFQRHALHIVAFLLALAVLEHVALGVNYSLPFWDSFRNLA